MDQTLTAPAPMDEHQEKQRAIAVINSLGPQDKKDAAQQLGLKPPSPEVTDVIWMVITISFALILVGAFIALAMAVLTYGKLSGDLLLTVFTTSAAFLAGLLTPSPTQAKSPNP